MRATDSARDCGDFTVPINRRLVAIAAMILGGIATAAPAPVGTYECTRAAFGEVMDTRAEPGTRSSLHASSIGPDHSCWIAFAEVSTKSSPTWVDVRSSGEARAVQMPGALRIPLTDVSTKNFLKSTPLILVGSGRDDGEVAVACGELKRDGFAQVQALRGGLRAWIAAGRPVLGDAAMLQTQDLIKPIEFQRQATMAQWLILGVDLPSATGLPVVPGAYRAISAGDDPQRVVTTIRQIEDEWSRKKSASVPTAMIVIALDEPRATQLRRTLRDASVANVLVLQEGLAGYRSFLSQQQGIAAAAGKALTRPCGSG